MAPPHFYSNDAKMISTNWQTTFIFFLWNFYLPDPTHHYYFQSFLSFSRNKFQPIHFYVSLLPCHLQFEPDPCFYPWCDCVWAHTSHTKNSTRKGVTTIIDQFCPLGAHFGARTNSKLYQIESYQFQYSHESSHGQSSIALSQHCVT